MSYFNKFPIIDYEFDYDSYEQYKDLSIMPSVVDELVGDYSNLESYSVKDGDTPDTVAYNFYRDSKMHWIIMLTNKFTNIYEDWPKTESQFREYVYEKYRYQTDSDGVAVTLSNAEVLEVVEFTGTASNNYTGEVITSNGNTVVLTPHHFIDDDGDIYTNKTNLATVDAFGRAITKPTLYPVSIWDYEDYLNEQKRIIFVPTASVAKKMKNELGNLVNE